MNPSRYQDYLSFRKKYSKYWGKKGDWERGEIEILDNISLFPMCEKGSTKDMIKKEFSPKDAEKNARIGIRDQNKWGVTVCEPLRFPNGAYLTFVRMISWGQLNSGLAGVVIIPKLTDGRYVFVKSYRNATRNFCLEFPRGAKDVDKNILKTIQAELSEEAGVKIIKGPVKIGEIFPDSGLLNSRVEISLCTVEIKLKTHQELTEAISGIEILTEEEIKKAVKNGSFINKKGKVYEFKDGFTLSALTLMSNKLK